VRFDDCKLDVQARASNVNSSDLSMDELVSSWRSATGLQITFRLTTMLMPPAEQYLFPVAVMHRSFDSSISDQRRDLLTLELLAGADDHVLSRSHDLEAYPVVNEMLLTKWTYSSLFTSSINQLEFEFRPSTDIFYSSEQPVMIGFSVLAPPSFRFYEASCQDLDVQRTRITFDINSGVNVTRDLFFKQRPTCEVVASPWMSEDGYYQNQLVIYMPPLIGLLKDVYYRVRTPILNPPLPVTHMLFKQAVEAATSPKFAITNSTLPIINIWHIFTFVWEAGDAGGGSHGAPVIGAFTSAALGRFAGVRKVDEVAWKGFELELDS